MMNNKNNKVFPINLVRVLICLSPFICFTQCESLYSDTDEKRLHFADLKMKEIENINEAKITDSVQIKKAIKLLEKERDEVCKSTPTIYVSEYTYNNTEIYTEEEVIATESDTLYVKLVCNDIIGGCIKYIKQ